MLFWGVLRPLSQVPPACEVDFDGVFEVIAISRGYVSLCRLLPSDHEPMPAKDAMLVGVSIYLMCWLAGTKEEITMRANCWESDLP